MQVQGVQLNRLLVFIFLMSCGSVLLYGQSAIQLSGKSLIELRRTTIELADLNWSRPLFGPTTWAATSTSVEASPFLSSQILRPNHTPNAYSYQDLAFFCKLEVQMEKKARFPIKFRLGEVQYVDKLEGKIRPLNQIE
ncbi:MAG: hypothetical protein AAF798_05985 [Bacteroidota bacterium]